MVDLEFISQFLQLAHAHDDADVLDQTTTNALRKLIDGRYLKGADAETLMDASALYQNLTQVLRLALDDEGLPADAPHGLQSLLARAAGLPDFSVLEAHLRDMEADVRGRLHARSGWRALGPMPRRRSKG